VGAQAPEHGETAAIARGVSAELGPLKDTQPKPDVGPFAK
jgi:hypothetical protein